jgi:hypothetical protein
MFVQAVDAAGNVASDNNKGQYRALAIPLPVIQGPAHTVYIPLIIKND